MIELTHISILTLCRQCTTKQTDTWSCGSFSLREAEKLMGLKVDDDQECPIAIRCRHVQSICKAVCKHVQGQGSTSPSTAKHGSPNFMEITSSDALKSGQASYDTMIHNNKYLPHPLFIDSPTFPPEGCVLDDSMTSPAFWGVHVNSQDCQTGILNSGEDTTRKKTPIADFQTGINGLPNDY